MKVSEIWVGIIIPILIGPIFIYFKSIYDNYTANKREHKLMIYTNKYDYYQSVLNEFYWPFYLKLLCIQQLNYSLPIKNEFEYISDNEESDNEESDNEESDNDNDNDNDNIKINISVEKDIILDIETIKLLENNLDLLFNQALEILEKNIYRSSSIDKQFIQFIKYCKIRTIIKEGSINHKYNIGYFGVKNNTNKLLSLIKDDLFKLQYKFNKLIECGPF